MNDWLRHTLATLAYRARKPLDGAPAGFSGFRAAETTRTPGQILAHLSDLFDWAITMLDGRTAWHSSEPGDWTTDVARFFAVLEAFDARLAAGPELSEAAYKLFQGPVADALTHVGQIAILRRMAGAPVRGENYVVADIAVGRCGASQTAPKKEFD